MIVDDPSGNSFIENPFAPAVDPTRIERHYVRSTEQVYSTQYTLRSSEQVHIHTTQYTLRSSEQIHISQLA